MQFLRRTARVTFFDHKKNEEISEDFKIEPYD